uniref:Uncharacterized protein n=1 Tax=Anopheles maculatus TaxID=74869 RepID=A0A182SA83_9DIPT
MKLHDFWCPIELTDIDGTVRSYPLPASKVECILLNSVGLRYEAEETRRRILAGELESPSVSHKDSLAIAGVQDSIRKQIGNSSNIQEYTALNNCASQLEETCGRNDARIFLNSMDNHDKAPETTRSLGRVHFIDYKDYEIHADTSN